jgi:hypothetical protein
MGVNMLPSAIETIRKLAAAGEQAGFTLEEMIEMLKGGMSVLSLLQVIEMCMQWSEPTLSGLAGQHSRWIM